MNVDPARRRELEEKYILDFQMLAVTRALRNSLLAAWAAPRLGRTDPEAYLREIKRAGETAPGDGDILQKVSRDLKTAGADVADSDLESLMREMIFEAAQILDLQRSTERAECPNAPARMRNVDPSNFITER